MNIIPTPSMPPPKGHYSYCIEHNGLLYLSGQLPLDPVSRELPHSIEEQTILALSNVEKVLNDAGRSREHILQMRIYISDISLWDRVNAVYCDFFGTHKPVRSIIPVAELHFGCLIELEVVAISD